jgi:hypothetical protein
LLGAIGSTTSAGTTQLACFSSARREIDPSSRRSPVGASLPPLFDSASIVTIAISLFRNVTTARSALAGAGAVLHERIGLLRRYVKAFHFSQRPDPPLRGPAAAARSDDLDAWTYLSERCALGDEVSRSRNA